MRVLHVFNELKYSGAEIMYANAASLFQKNDIEMFALSTGNKIGDFLPRFEEENIKVHYLPLTLNEKNPLILLRYFRNVYKLLKNNHIQVVHIHRSKHFLFFSFVSFLTNAKTIRTVHNVFKHRKYTWIKGYLDRFLARKLFKVKFQTIGNSVYQNELNYYKNPSIVVNNWYDHKNFYPAYSNSEQTDLRKKLGIPNSSFVIISTGGCSPVKNHHDIIKALHLVNKEINCTYLHLGQGKTENEEHILAKTLKVYDKIFFLGNRKNVRDYLIASNVYLMPSRFEGLSIAAIEAMACGLPSILYDVPGLRDLINKDDNGFLIKEDYKILAQNILKLSTDIILSKTKGQNARKFVEKEFSVNSGVKGILKLYNLN